MTDPVEEIARQLISAAHKRYGDPGDPPGDYVADVASDTDVAAYFRRVVELAAASRVPDYDEFNQDADFVMHAGLDHLLTDPALPDDQRQLIEHIKSLKTWAGQPDDEEQP